MEQSGLTEQLEFTELQTCADHIKSSLSEDKIIGISIDGRLAFPRHASGFFQITADRFPPVTSWISNGVQVIELPDTGSEHRINCIRILKQIGAAALILISVCNRLNEKMKPDEMILVSDHINLAAGNPLIGKNDPRIGPRYTNMVDPYDKKWAGRIKKTAIKHQLNLSDGIYVNLDRPITPAERIMLRQLGGDVVGAGLADDVITAVHCGLPVAAMGYVDPLELQEKGKETQHHDSDYAQKPQTDMFGFLNDLFAYV